MATINFQEFEMWDGIAHRQKRSVDVRESLADVIYRNVAGIRGHALAHKVYESEGAVDYTDGEIHTLRSLVEQLCVGPMIDGLNEQLKTNNKEVQL